LENVQVEVTSGRIQVSVYQRLASLSFSMLVLAMKKENPARGSLEDLSERVLHGRSRSV
jgi:hypothetical protein